ncbi:MAG: hypothetical protein AAB074_03930 [Planctomycetota bacterium]
MNWDHWEVLLLAPIMLVDYALTILGARMAGREYASHFRSEHYELNPVWQAAIKTKRWFNPRHHVLALALPIVLFYVEQSSRGNLAISFAVLNAGILSMYAMILGQHASNLLVFRRLAMRPGDVTGSITMKHSFELANARYRALACAFPLALGAALSRHPVAIGTAIGPAFYLLANLVWSAGRSPDKAILDGPAKGASGEPASPSA